MDVSFMMSAASDSFSRRLDEIVDAITREHGIVNYKYSVVNKLAKGENYLGEIKRVVVEEDGGAKLDLIMKSSVVTSGETPMFRYYQCEDFAYKTYFPALNEIQKGSEEKRIKFAKCLHSSLDRDKQIIVLEDMNASGYVMADRLKSLDKDHIRLVIKTQALYHALAFAYKHQTPEDVYKKQLEVCVVKEELNEEYIEWCKIVAKEYIGLIEDEGLRSKMVEFSKSDIRQSMYECWDVDKDERACQYNVLIHCDLWTNNFLFKYNEDNKVVDMVMVDWQTLKPASPVCDLIFTLYLCLDERTREEMWEELLDLYYDTLKNRLKDLKLDPVECFPESAYRKHLQDKLYYGLITSVFGFHVVYGDKQNTSDVEDDREKDETKVTLNAACVREMNGVLRHLCKMKII